MSGVIFAKRVEAFVPSDVANGRADTARTRALIWATYAAGVATPRVEHVDEVAGGFIVEITEQGDAAIAAASRRASTDAPPARVS